MNIYILLGRLLGSFIVAIFLCILALLMFHVGILIAKSIYDMTVEVYIAFVALWGVLFILTVAGSND